MTTQAQIQKHYRKDVRKSSDFQLAVLVLGDGMTDPQIRDALKAEAHDEAKRRGHDLPYFWALTYS